MQAKDKNPSMPFTRGLSEEELDTVSLCIDQDQFGPLFELIREYGSFELTMQNADKFSMRFGKKLVLNVVRDFHRCIVTLGQISSLTPGAAELLCKISNLLFNDRKHRFMIDTTNLKHEAMLWEACFKLQIPLKPKDSAQAKRFLEYAERKNIQTKINSIGFSQTMNDHSRSSFNPGEEK